MGKTSNGIKAGTVAGLVYGIIVGVFTAISLVIYKSQVLSALTKFMSTNSVYAEHGITAQSLYNDAFISGIVVDVIISIVFGLILGIIYARVIKRSPGSKSAIGGIIFGLIMWLVLGVLLSFSGIKEYGYNFFALRVVGALLGAISYGYILVVMYDRYERSTVTVTEPAR